MSMSSIKGIAALLVVMAVSAHGQGKPAAQTETVPLSAPWSQRIAASYLLRHPNAVAYDTGLPGNRWTYEQGLMLEAFRQMWLFTGDKKYFDFIRGNIDQFVDKRGAIRTYKLQDYNLDMVAGGRALLFLYQQTRLEEYRLAAALLRSQLCSQPRTRAGGFWHKKIYPYQMWLDGLFMAEPFYAWYSVMFDEQSAFDDIINQFVVAYRQTVDPATGLCYHVWDESRAQLWADSATGHSPSFWGRSMGWYMMALVDVLDFVPAGHPRRAELIGILRDLSAALLRFRDPDTKLWYQVVDRGGRPGNYLESSASAMFVYALAKGANKGYLENAFAAAKESFQGLTANLASVDPRGFVDLHRTCRGAGLGGTPYRDGTYAYYVSVPNVTNDMKGIGAFLLAAIEIEKGENAARTREHRD